MPGFRGGSCGLPEEEVFDRLQEFPRFTLVFPHAYFKTINMQTLWAVW